MRLKGKRAFFRQILAGPLWKLEFAIWSLELKGKRAVFRQILAGAPLEVQICHLGLRTGHFDGHFEAKSDRFEAKIVIWTVWKATFSQIKAAFFR